MKQCMLTIANLQSHLLFRSEFFHFVMKICKYRATIKILSETKKVKLQNTKQKKNKKVELKTGELMSANFINLFNINSYKKYPIAVSRVFYVSQNTNFAHANCRSTNFTWNGNVTVRENHIRTCALKLSSKYL